MIKSSWPICWISGLEANAFLKAKRKRNTLFVQKKKNSGSLLFLGLHHLILILNTPVNDWHCFLTCTGHTKFGGLDSHKVKCKRHLVPEKLKCWCTDVFPTQWLNRSWMHTPWLYSAICGPALQSVGVICTIYAVCIWGNKYLQKCHKKWWGQTSLTNLTWFSIT